MLLYDDDEVLPEFEKTQLCIVNLHFQNGQLSSFIKMLRILLYIKATDKQKWH